MRFCSLCKQYFSFGTKDERKTFAACGHSDDKSNRLLRDLGRKRPGV